MNLMWKVRYKTHNDSQAWTTLGTYGSQSVAMNQARRVAPQNHATQVLDPSGRVVWSV